MKYNEKLADKVRKALSKYKVEEKKMMGGLTFLINGKMALGILVNDLMCRIDPADHEETLKRRGTRDMDLTGKSNKDFILISQEGTTFSKDFDYWIDLAVAFNQKKGKH